VQSARSDFKKPSGGAGAPLTLDLGSRKSASSFAGGIGRRFRVQSKGSLTSVWEGESTWMGARVVPVWCATVASVQRAPGAGGGQPAGCGAAVTQQRSQRTGVIACMLPRGS
jgi:hypothetical protein